MRLGWGAGGGRVARGVDAWDGDERTTAREAVHLGNMVALRPLDARG